MKSIRFKSTPENYRKEYLGLKRNTVRKNDGGIRFEVLDDFINLKWHGLTIEIQDTQGYESFERVVTDVTKFEDYYIISWN